MIRQYLLVLAVAIIWTIGVLALAGWFCPCLAVAADAAGYRIASAPRADGVSAYVVDVVSGPAVLAGEYPAAADGSADIPLPAAMPEGTVTLDITACGPAPKSGARPCSYAERWSFPFPAPLPGAAGLRVVFRP